MTVFCWRASKRDPELSCEKIARLQNVRSIDLKNRQWCVAAIRRKMPFLDGTR
jgi:hypothetical protein